MICFEADGAILQTFLIGQAAAISGKANDVLEPRLGDDGRRRFKELDDLGVVLQSVEAVLNPARHAADHRADHVMRFESGKILGLKQVDGFKPHPFAGGAEVLQADFAIAPFADRVVDLATGRASGRLGSPQAVGQGSRYSNSSRGVSESADSGPARKTCAHEHCYLPFWVKSQDRLCRCRGTKWLAVPLTSWYERIWLPIWILRVLWTFTIHLCIDLPSV